MSITGDKLVAKVKAKVGISTTSGHMNMPL